MQELDQAIDELGESVTESGLSPPSISPIADKPSSPISSPSVVLSGTRRNWVLPAAISSLCTAAALLLMMSLFPLDKQPSISKPLLACRWSPTELLKSNGGSALFQEIADGATWPFRPHDTRVAMASDIANYRTRCSEMILTEFKFLSDVDQKFLRDKCRSWTRQSMN